MSKQNRSQRLLRFGRIAIAGLTIAIAGEAFAQDSFGSEPGSAPKEELTEKQQSYFIFSSVGPGAGFGTIGMGGRIYFIIPTFDLNYVRGLTNEFDFVLNINTLGVITFSDIGLRYRLVGSRDSGFALGVKAQATPILVFVAAGDGAAGGFGFGMTPGAVISFGSAATQFSLGVDVPIFLGAAGFATGGGNSASDASSDVTPMIRPTATIEFSVGVDINMYVQAAGYIAVESGAFLAPIIAVGAAW